MKKFEEAEITLVFLGRDILTNSCSPDLETRSDETAIPGYSECSEELL